jgi:hypothetical protein
MAYNPNFKAPDLEYGRLIEDVTHSHDERIHAELAPANWLPVSATANNKSVGLISHEIMHQQQWTKMYYVMTPGKLVALTREGKGVTEFGEDLLGTHVGRIVPAGLRASWKRLGGSDVALEYTALDVSERIQDLTTGLPVAAAKTVTKTALTTALRNRGLLRSDESLEEFVSAPIGWIPTAVAAWCGGDGVQPRGFRHHNLKRASETVVVQKGHALRLPQVPLSGGTVEVAAATNVFSALSQLEAAASTTYFITPTILGSTSLTARYGAANADAVGLVLGRKSVEVSFITPLVINSSTGVDKTSTILKSRKNSLEAIKKVGDYYVDTAMGILFMFESGGNALPTNMAAGDDIVFSYNDVSDTSQPTVWASVRGDVKPGDFLVCDGQSNFRKYNPAPTPVFDLVADDVFVAASTGGAVTKAVTVWTSSVAEASAVTVDVDYSQYDRPEDIVGQVYYMFRSPRKDMEKVFTYHDERLSNGLLDRMPGSATEGYTTRQTYALGGQFEVVVNFFAR